MKHIVLFIGVLSLLGCASRPKLYPNDRYKSVGKEVAQRDTDQCIKDAEAYLESSKGKQIAKGAGGGAAMGAAFGAVTGIFYGNPVRGALRGGTVGGAVGGTAGALSPDQIKQRYVNQCLAEKGYQVIGWD